MQSQRARWWWVVPAALLVAPAARAEEGAGKALLEALPRAKVTLAAGLRQAAMAPAVPLSAKLEMDEHGKLSLSVYTAARGLGAEPKDQVLQELAGSPEGKQWKPEAETIKEAGDLAHATEQLALMRQTHLTLAEVVARAGKAGTVFSIEPVKGAGKPLFLVLVADHGKVRQLTFDLASGAPKGNRLASAVHEDVPGQPDDDDDDD